MITLEGDNIKILKMDCNKRCIEVVDFNNNILYKGTYRFDVIRERGTPIKIKLYHYTAKPVEEALNNEYEQLKKEVKNLNFIKARCCNEYMRMRYY